MCVLLAVILNIGLGPMKVWLVAISVAAGLSEQIVIEQWEAAWYTGIGYYIIYFHRKHCSMPTKWQF